MRTISPIEIRLKSGETVHVPTEWSNFKVANWIALQQVTAVNAVGTVAEKRQIQLAAACGTTLEVVQSLPPNVFIQCFNTLVELMDKPVDEADPIGWFDYEGKRYSYQYIWAVQGVHDEVALKRLSEGKPEFAVAYLANHLWVAPTTTRFGRLRRRLAGDPEPDNGGFIYTDIRKYRLESETALNELDVLTFRRLLFFWTTGGGGLRGNLRSSIRRRLAIALSELEGHQQKTLTMPFVSRWLMHMAYLLTKSLVIRTYRSSVKLTSFTLTPDTN